MSLMCPEFIQSFLAGLVASGVLTSCLRFLTKVAFEESDDGLRKEASTWELENILVYAYFLLVLEL
ncbi:equilibrative nucleoside transporter [Medicago truncatula]|uniref:Equilibrative nucleoside transporter n=1 Tax=Medicago truncatula TaxID=3880 RepID=A0A072VEA1_MEDTR|nr:equilibrative nucleoside transporter [Medicago truncatula]